MRRWIVAVLFSTLLSCPAVSGASDNTVEAVKLCQVNYPLMNIPIGQGPKSSAGTAQDKKKDGEALSEQEKKKILDKKIDDAINKAWEKDSAKD
jgi:hypothetical protein